MSRRPQRWLVVAPHPDDEALGAGGLMASARLKGDDVYVVLLTSGDGFPEDTVRYYLQFELTPDEYLHLGYERQAEAQKAMAELGVDPAHVFFLGFPDGGLDSLWLTHWQDQIWTSRTTQCRETPYLGAWRRNAAYQGRVLVQLLMELYETIQPTRLVMPSAFDTHPDHWGTNAFATLAYAYLRHSQERWQQVERWGYLVHWPSWPFPLAYRPEQYQALPKALADLDQEVWHAENLSLDVVSQKRQALLQYESQVELIKPFMLAFCRKTEWFAEENQFRLAPFEHGLAVFNPERGWMSNVLGRGPGIERVGYGRTAEYDFAEVMFDARGFGEGQMEVSLHPIDDRHQHFHWRLGPQDPLKGGDVIRHSDRWEFRWPREWIGNSPWVMAGCQIYWRQKCVGKVPFRLVPWGDLSVQ